MDAVARPRADPGLLALIAERPFLFLRLCCTTSTNFELVPIDPSAEGHRAWIEWSNRLLNAGQAVPIESGGI